MTDGEWERTKAGEGGSGPGDVRDLRLICAVLERRRVQRSSYGSWRMVEQWGIGKDELRQGRLVEVWGSGGSWPGEEDDE
jgi:hypothetical protein